jgi:hypothetical protein
MNNDNIIIANLDDEGIKALDPSLYIDEIKTFHRQYIEFGEAFKRGDKVVYPDTSNIWLSMPLEMRCTIIAFFNAGVAIYNNGIKSEDLEHDKFQAHWVATIYAFHYGRIKIQTIPDRQIPKWNQVVDDLEMNQPKKKKTRPKHGKSNLTFFDVTKTRKGRKNDPNKFRYN